MRACGRSDLAAHKVIDTLAMARQKFPGAPASLDALCRRFGVDNSNRDLHGALIDSELLAGVYLELSGGRQPGLVFEAAQKTNQNTSQNTGQNASFAAVVSPHGTSRQAPRAPQKRRDTALAPRLSDAERAAHMDFLQNLPQRALWLRDEAEA